MKSSPNIMSHSTGRRVVAHLHGGLGNQLFIYAAGRALADRLHCPLVINGDDFPHDRIYHRQYELGDFQIRYDELLALTPRWRWWLRRRRDRLFQKIGTAFYLEDQDAHYQGEPLTVPDQGTLHLAGEYQSEHYFLEDAARVAKDLRLIDPKPGEATSEYTAIHAAVLPVFLHLRSFKDIPGRADGSAALPAAYYQSALARMKQEIGPFSLFVFSDDPVWAKSHVTWPGDLPITFITPSGRSAHEDQLRDFFLMQQCSHGIISNSSFSWWAAWLMEHRRVEAGQKVVVIRGPRKHVAFSPDRWILVEP